MDCAQIRKTLPAYLDGMDLPEERERIDRHLTSCVSCRKTLEEYQKARERIRTLEEVDPPPRFAQNIMAQVEEEGARGGLLKKLFYPLHIKIPIQAIATVAIAFLAIQAYRAIEPQRAAVQQYGATAPAAPKEEIRKEDSKPIVVPPAAPSPQAEIRRTEEPKKIAPSSRAEDKTSSAPASREMERAEPPPAPAAPREETQKEAKKPAVTPPAAKSPQAEIQRAEGLKEKAASSQTKDKASLAPATTASGAASPRETERAEAPLAQKRARTQPAAPAPPRKLETASPRQAGALVLTLEANDSAAAAKNVESVLRDLGGERIEKSQSGEGETVTASLPAKSIKDLLKRLGPGTEAKEKDLAFQSPDEIVALKIEIRQR